jgi:acyl-CoA oxidase
LHVQFFFSLQIGWLACVTRFIEHLQTEIPRGIKEQLEVLCNTYALSQMVESAGDFLATGYMTGKQVAFAKDQLKHLFDKVSLFELLSTHNLLCEM